MVTTRTSETIRLPNAPDIADLSFRAYRGHEDLPALADVMRSAELADGTNAILGPEAMANWVDNVPDFDPHRDILVAQIGDRPVAFSERTRRVRDGIRVFDSYGWVMPEWRRHGIGRAMLRFNEAANRTRVSAEADDGQATLGSWSPGTNAGNVVLLEAEGYEIVRWFFEMERPDLEGIPNARLPDGLELRPVPPDRLRDVIVAAWEAFEDHWGAPERTEVDIRRMLGDPDTDPSLWHVAWAGDEVAGSVLAAIYRDENEAIGIRRAWLDQVSVRRPWRRQGVASALMVATLRTLRERDVERAALGVDADNPHGALGMYERLGFRPIHRAMAYRKPL